MGRKRLPNLIFVYGTLRKGGHYHRAIAGAKHVGNGRINGKMYSMGRYPAVIVDEPGTVIGEVYDVTSDMIRTMDAIEGFFPEKPESSFYVRRKVPVTLDGGEIVETWVYECSKIKDRPEIKSGDFMQYLKAGGEART